MAVRHDHQLGCGRDIDEVWERVGLPPDSHEEGCPDCQAARENLSDLNAVAGEMARADREDPLLQIDAGVFDQIVAIARAEVRRGRRLPLQEPDPARLLAELTVSEQTVATIVRQVSDELPGIETRRCSVSLAEAAGEPTTTPPPLPATFAITLRVSTTLAVPIPEVVAMLRERIIAAIATTIGVNVSTVDVVVEDLHEL